MWRAWFMVFFCMGKCSKPLGKSRDRSNSTVKEKAHSMQNVYSHENWSAIEQYNNNYVWQWVVISMAILHASVTSVPVVSLSTRAVTRPVVDCSGRTARVNYNRLTSLKHARSMECSWGGRNPMTALYNSLSPVALSSLFQLFIVWIMSDSEL